MALTKQVNHFVGSVSSCVPGGMRWSPSKPSTGSGSRKHDLGIVKPMFYARTYFVYLEESRVNGARRITFDAAGVD